VTCRRHPWPSQKATAVSRARSRVRGINRRIHTNQCMRHPRGLAAQRLCGTRAVSVDRRFCGPRLFGPVTERSNSRPRIGGHSHALDDQTAAFLLVVGAHSVNFSRRLSRRTTMKKYRSKRKGRRSFDTAIEYGTVAITATEKTRTPQGGTVRATCFKVHNLRP
jgi:hypothetical protein